MAGRIRHLALVGVVALSVLWTSPSLAQHGGGGGCGQGGGEDDSGTGHDSGPGNNLSVPVVFAEGMGILGVPAAADPGLRPRPGEGVMTLPFFDPSTVVTRDGITYYPQMTTSTWQAGWVTGAPQGEAAMVSWGDNLLARSWSARSRIRVEVALYQDGAPALTAFNMTSLFGTQSDEVWGTDGSTTPSSYRAVYAVTPRLIIEKITGPGGTVVPGVTRFEGSIADSFETEGPERFAAEVNGAGRIIYGYNWRLPQWTCPLEQKVGWWRLTLTLDPVARYTVPAEEEGGIPQTFTVTRNVRLTGIDPLDLSSERKYRPVLASPYTSVLEIQLTAGTGGGGGSGGGGHEGETPDDPPDPGDLDADGLPDAWEVEFGLDPSVDTATADPDGDGLTNDQELAAGSHPRGIWTRYFAEGAATDLLSTRYSVFNTSPSGTSTVLIRFLTAAGEAVPHVVTVPPRGRVLVDAAAVSGVAGTTFGAIVEASTALSVERTTTWEDAGHGSHASEGSSTASTTWYLPEGATHSGFSLFYLLANPGAVDAEVRVRFVRPAPLPELVRTYLVPAHARRDVWVNRDSDELMSTDVSAVITSSVPIVAERSMYLAAEAGALEAGTSSTAAASPAATWYLAEGATGRWFDAFLLLLNPGAMEALVDVTYLRADGAPLTRTRVLPPGSRVTVPLQDDTGWTDDAAFSAVVRSANAVPIVVERAMWWPGPGRQTWTEGHSTIAATAGAARWALAGPAEVEQTEGYLLVLNPTSDTADVLVTVTPDGGTPLSATMRVPAMSRQTLAVDEATFPGLARRPYSVMVESQGASPVPLVVDFSTYTSGGATRWGAGTSRTATPTP